MLAALVVVLDSSGVLGADGGVFIDDSAQLVGGLAAAGCAWWTGYRARGRQRWWRLLLGCGMAGWSTGQAIWSWYQVVRGVPMPSPSWADLGYLTLPVFALPALLIMAAEATSRAHGMAALTRSGWRSHLLLILDGTIVVCSMVMLGWEGILSNVVNQRTPNVWAFLIAIAYPTTDQLMVVMVILVALVRRLARQDRMPLLLLGLGLVGIAVSDSVFAYLVSIGASEMKPVSDTGFVIGPALVALAMVAPSFRRRRRIGRGQQQARRVTEWPHLLLPYIPAVAAGVLIIVQTVLGRPLTGLTIYLGLLIAALVLARQFITLSENTALLERVRISQERLTFQAFHDPLTGLPNRALFRDRLAHAVDLHRRDLHPLAVLFVDLDDFKAVNDRLGHSTGDGLLKAVGERLLGCVRPADTVARLGGDEFAVLLEGDLEIDPPELVAERVLAAVSRPFTVGERTFTAGASIGVVVPDRTEAELTADELLRRADVAMFSGKREGKGRLVLYRPELARTPDLAVLLAEAISPDRIAPDIDVEYQPIVRMSDHRLVAVEALARWRGSVAGEVRPDVFVPIAERIGLMERLDEVILDRACSALRMLNRQLDHRVDLHVNITGTRMGCPGLEYSVRAALDRYGLSGNQLVLEITETNPIPDLEAVAITIDRLRELGIRFALDDFGTGFNTLTRLNALHIDVVKLDGSLAVADPDDPRANAVHRSVVTLGRSLDVAVIAEGVETEEQASHLAARGYQLGQGYLFGRPAPVRELLAAGAGKPANAASS